EAAAGQIGSAVDQLLLFCYQYDLTTGQYRLVIMNVLRLASLLTVATMGGFIAIMFGRERKRRKASRAPGMYRYVVGISSFPRAGFDAGSARGCPLLFSDRRQRLLCRADLRAVVLLRHQIPSALGDGATAAGGQGHASRVALDSRPLWPDHVHIPVGGESLFHDYASS